MHRGGIVKSLILGASVAALSLPAAAWADTLQEALTEAYLHNPTLLAARAGQRATDENVAIERSAGLPSVTGTASYTEIVEGASTSGPNRFFGAGVDLGVPIYSGGAVRNSIRGAKSRVEAGQADLRGTESSIFTQVVAAYMDVLRGEALASLSGNQVDVLTVNLQATSDRFEIGDLTRTDVAQSQSRLALAQGDYRNSQANLITARENYIALVGKAPDDLQPPPPLPNLPASVDEAVDYALANNPDLIAAKERAEASSYDIDVAGSGRLPQVSVFAGYDYQNTLNSLRQLDGTVSPIQSGKDAQIGVSLRMPLFQGGRPAALERQAQARSAAALEQVIGAERDTIAQVRSAWSSWQASLAVIESSQVAVDAASLSLEGVRAENSIGSRQILDVLNAEQELLSARVQLVTARRNAYVAGFSLLAAMGRAEARDLGFIGEGLLYDPVENYDRVRGKVWDWDRDPDPVATATSTVDVAAPDASVPEVGENETVSGY
ncbi:TolC family outer membrane protein [Qipengyuania sp. YG27]|uniref:TolC family outer membrane protein n=1 Tax=Qipengyuania mesophila TaxID=2867246 RepID=A0ABS7JUE7_9SPHN|nr:TolC family outer membrane protein [Qipengyuania mesophila]MBX7501270.1 TolC family outer membrane protein [Qipengyuania mesophila]